MKRKSVPAEPVVIDKELLEKAKAAIRAENPRPVLHCVICDADSAPNSTEQLCWVCRRLKISAWRESEQQIAAQE
jgi:hypothetical protein